MEMRKTSVWISRSLGLLFVFSNFGHLVGGGYPKSKVVQGGIKNSQVSGSTSYMATLQCVFKKYWYLAVPVIGVGALCARQLKNNSVVKSNKSNPVEIKSKTEQGGAAQEKQPKPVDSSIGAQEEPQLQELEKSGWQKLLSHELSVSRNGEVKSSEPTESLISENSSAWWQNPEDLLAWLKDNPGKHIPRSRTSTINTRSL